MAQFDSTNNRAILKNRPRRPNPFQKQFLKDLGEVWMSEGIGAIRILAKEEPAKFVQICAGLMPKEIEFGFATVDLDDSELDDLIARAKQQLSAPKPELRLIGEEKVGECLTIPANKSQG